MNILITAGGTSEKIDEVRSITNHSTGQLGSLIAEAFLAENAKVDYVTTARAIRPSNHKNIHFYQIEGTQELSDTLSMLLVTNTYDAVIHSMAVSDFTPTQSLSQEAFLAKINQLATMKKTITAEDLALLMTDSGEKTTKISSNTDHLFLILKKTPKVIQQIKKSQPHTLLVGFKLLVDASKEELLAVTKNSLAKNQADYVLANDLTSIQQNQHTGYLLNNTGEIVSQAETKEEIAQMIVKTIIHRL